jgi:hypothetical protein
LILSHWEGSLDFSLTECASGITLWCNCRPQSLACKARCPLWVDSVEKVGSKSKFIEPSS